MINEQWLETFIHLVEIGHFTKTATRLNMTQPGVSQHINKIEEQVGRPLITRVGKKFELTHAGELLFKFGKKKQEDEEKLFEDLQVDSVEEGVCLFGCSGSMATLLYPIFLRRQKKFPKLIVKIEAAPNTLIIDKIRDHSLDVGIVTQLPLSDDLESESIGFDSLCMVLPKKYSDKKINIEVLDSLGFINHPDGFHYVTKVMNENFKKDFVGANKLKIRGYINQISQILNPVAEGVGYTVVPESMVKQFYRPSKLYVLPLKNNVKDELYLIRKKHTFRSRRYEWFEAEICKSVQKI